MPLHAHLRLTVFVFAALPFSLSLSYTFFFSNKTTIIWFGDMIKQLVCLSLAASVVRVYSLGALVVRIKSWLVCSLHSWFYAHAARFHVLPTQMRNDKMQDN